MYKLREGTSGKSNIEKSLFSLYWVIPHNKSIIWYNNTDEKNAMHVQTVNCKEHNSYWNLCIKHEK